MAEHTNNPKLALKSGMPKNRFFQKSVYGGWNQGYVQGVLVVKA